METIEKQKTLIIGMGEVGTSLFNVLMPFYDVYGKDIEPQFEDIEFPVINICYPYSKDFIETTKKYIELYKPMVTIIHSTVPVGTTRQCGEKVVHSPVNGKHPHLEQGIKTFVKYIGGNNGYSAFEAVKFLQGAGVTTKVVTSSEASELSKLLCTAYYGWNIVFMKEVVRICDELKLPFHEIYTEWNYFYNAGYDALGRTEYKRPTLIPIDGSIGGHCIINNCDLLDDWLTKTIKQRNKTYEKRQKDKNLA